MSSDYYNGSPSSQYQLNILTSVMCKSDVYHVARVNVLIERLLDEILRLVPCQRRYPAT